MDARAGVVVGAAIALFGAVLSGPVALWIVHAVQPQPVWQDAATFARSYHGVQALPYFAGLLLVGGFVALIASLHVLAPESYKARTACSLGFVAVFAAIIGVNYAIQTTFVPTLAKHWSAENASLLAGLTMANPDSLGWALEMWGYAVLGVATWLCAPVFSHWRLERLTAFLFLVNGPISILGAVATATSPGWVLTDAGILAFAGWNVLVVFMTALAAVSMRQRRDAV